MPFIKHGKYFFLKREKIMRKTVAIAVLVLLGVSVLYAQSEGVIGKVEQKGTTFTVFDATGKKITNFSSPNQELLGWGRDFFVLKSGTTFTTYDARCRKISNVSVGGATTGSVQIDGFTVKVGSSNQRFDKNCKKK
jgi:hypothetical protein